MQNFNYGSLFLANDATIAWIVVAVVAVLAFVAALLCWKFGGKAVKKNFEKELGDISAQRNRMLDDVREESRAIKKEAILEAKEQEIKLRNEFERESKGRPGSSQQDPGGNPAGSAEAQCKKPSASRQDPGPDSKMRFPECRKKNEKQKGCNQKVKGVIMPQKQNRAIAPHCCREQGNAPAPHAGDAP